MDFRFSEEQLLFRDAIRSFLKGECTPAAIRATWDGPAKAPLRRGLAELGLMGLAVAEEYGGLGLSEVDAVLTAEECGLAGLPEPLAESALVAAPLLAAASPEVAAKWLPSVAAGKAVLGLQHEVNGFVTDGAAANLFLLMSGDALYAVPREGVKLAPLPSIDSSHQGARLTWTPLASHQVAGNARVLWEQAFDRAALYAAADMLGAAQRVLNMAVEYANQRQQFGKFIGSFQAVKHLLADVQVKITFAKPVVYHAALLASRNSAQRSLRVSHAKIAAGDAAILAARRAFQVHGAIGYTWEYDLQIWLKRIWATVATWGTAAWHRDRLAATVLAPNADLGAGRIWAA
jgi:alkylation response protein AidB-like acyl-CoA dehydrogenase